MAQTNQAGFTKDEFSFLPTLQGIVQSLQGSGDHVTAIGPAIFELETKYQSALKLLDSCPEQDKTLEEQEAKYHECHDLLVKRRASYQRYQRLVSEQIQSDKNVPSQPGN